MTAFSSWGDAARTAVCALLARGGPARFDEAQRAFVATMFEVLARLIVAGSTDPALQRELAALPDGYTIGFSIYGDTVGFRVAKRGSRFARVERASRADLELVFKHLAHAFALVSFQESSAVAYANDRFVTHGDIGNAMRFLRCLDRNLALMLPPPIAARALKAVPSIPTGERLKATATTVAGLVRGLIPGGAP